jgi:hypothetical protein
VTMPEGTDPGDHDPAQLRMLFRDYLWHSLLPLLAKNR